MRWIAGIAFNVWAAIPKRQRVQPLTESRVQLLARVRIVPGSKVFLRLQYVMSLLVVPLDGAEPPGHEVDEPEDGDHGQDEEDQAETGHGWRERTALCEFWIPERFEKHLSLLCICVLNSPVLVCVGLYSESSYL